jgi:hypothetical protein
MTWIALVIAHATCWYQGPIAGSGLATGTIGVGGEYAGLGCEEDGSLTTGVIGVGREYAGLGGEEDGGLTTCAMGMGEESGLRDSGSPISRVGANADRDSCLG